MGKQLSDPLFAVFEATETIDNYKECHYFRQEPLYICEHKLETFKYFAKTFFSFRNDCILILFGPW